jgi:sortase A
MLLAGALVLGFLAWQYAGTNWVSERRQHQILEQLDESWADGVDQVPSSGTTAAAVVRVPRFGDDYAVPLLEGTSDDALASGIGHVAGTAAPGEEGNLVLAAHRVTHGEPFADLPSLRVGDEVVVDTATMTFTYVMDTGGEDLEVSFDAGWVLDEAPRNPDPDGVGPAGGPGQPLITLTTCAELFHTDERLVVFGHLVASRPRR